jgi:geranylgeranyl diphosphate synthase type II
MLDMTTPRAVTTEDGALVAVLEGFFDEQIRRAGGYGWPYRRVWEALRDACRGGKRIRPRMVLLAYRHLCGDRSAAPAALQIAAAFEILHTGFLIHDDVIDHDLVRRGRPNVAGAFVVEALERGWPVDAAAAYAESCAILAGDLMISAAHRLVATAELPPGPRTALLDLLDDCVFQAAAGEHADVRGTFGTRPDPHRILSIIEEKTAGYSFAGPLRAGAILAGAGSAVCDSLGTIGRHLGIGFQLRDDVLGVFGTENITGKSAIGDLREGKETLLIAHSRNHPDWALVADSFGRRDLDDDGAGRLREVIRGSGALDRVERTIDEHVERALAVIARSALPESLRLALAQTAQLCTWRER